MGSKIVTEFDFLELNDAYAALNNALVELDSAVEAKQKVLSAERDKFDADLLKKDTRIKNLKKSSEKALASMESIIEKLNLILDKDGSNNNRN